jgi:hypothetical protein
MCDRCKDQVSDAFVNGMARILWGNAWADHAEEHDCFNLSGQEVTEVMPEIPEVVYRKAERLSGAIEQANGLSLPAIFSQAMKAEGKTVEHEDYWGADAEGFGSYLAHMAVGSGVSWFDDHAEFKLSLGTDAEPRDLVVPETDIACELQLFAGDTCENESRSGLVACSECACYGQPRETCKNCGEEPSKYSALN